MHTFGQLGATLRSFGIRFGYYNPRDWKAAKLIDPIVDTWADAFLANYSIFTAKNEEKDDRINEYISGIGTRFHNLCEANLGVLEAQGQDLRFIAGPKVTIADVVLVSYVANIVNNPACVISPAAKGLLE